MIQSLGKVIVPQPGVPVRLSTLFPANIDRYTCHGVMIQALPTNAGKVYVGLANLNRVTFEGILAFLAIPTANVIPSYSAALTLSPAGVNLTEMCIDADQINDGVVVSVLIT